MQLSSLNCIIKRPHQRVLHHPIKAVSSSAPPSPYCLVSLHQANLKKFMEYVQQRIIEKVSRFLEKGLDPNFHDPDTGGEQVCANKYSLRFSSELIVFFSTLICLFSCAFSLCALLKMTIYDLFCEISLLLAGKSWIIFFANLFMFMQMFVQP